MSTEAAIQKGKGIVSNPAFLMIFTLCACVAGAGSFTALLSFFDFCITGDECGGAQIGSFQAINFISIALLIVVAILFGVAWFTGLKENLFIGIIVLMGVLSGFLAD